MKCWGILSCLESDAPVYYLLILCMTQLDVHMTSYVKHLISEIFNSSLKYYILAYCHIHFTQV